MAQNSEIWGVKKKGELFWHLKNRQFSDQQMANRWLTRKSKPQVCRVPSGTPMDWSLMKSANAEYPLSCRKCVEKWTICTRIDATPPKCIGPPRKWYHHIAQPSAHLKPPHNTLTARCSFIKKNLIFWRAYILTKVLKRPWSRQKLTYVKMDQKGS